MDNTTEKTYAAWPSRLYLVDKAGKVAYATLLDEQSFDARDLELAVQATGNR
jgi:hypothetical protein